MLSLVIFFVVIVIVFMMGMIIFFVVTVIIFIMDVVIFFAVTVIAFMMGMIIFFVVTVIIFIMDVVIFFAVTVIAFMMGMIIFFVVTVIIFIMDVVIFFAVTVIAFMMGMIIFFVVTVVIFFVVRFETAFAMTFFNIVFFIGIVIGLFLFLRTTAAIFSPTPEASHYVPSLNLKFCRYIIAYACLIVIANVFVHKFSGRGLMSVTFAFEYMSTNSSQRVVFYTLRKDKFLAGRQCDVVKNFRSTV